MISQDPSIFGASPIPQLTPTKELTADEFKASIEPLLQGILDRTFPDKPEKRRIKKQSQAWAFACPFCGDSYGDPRKKRGGFIFKPGEFYHMFHCFNCGHSTSIKNFFKNFKINLDGSTTDYLDNHQAVQGIRTYNNFNATVTSSMFNTEEMDRLGVTKEYLIENFGLQRISETNKNNGYHYLVGRCQYNHDCFLYDPKANSVLILNLTATGKIVGFQIRPINYKGTGPKYITVSLKTLHEKILRDNIEPTPDQVTLSMLFNIFRVNLSKPIMATEGPMDALLLPNAIAILGANKAVPLELPLFWVFDYDKAGNKHTDEHLQLGHYVFQWEKLIKDYNLPKQDYINGLIGGKPRKWDITDFFVYCRNNRIPLPKYWKPYFSNTSMDIDPLSL